MDYIRKIQMYPFIKDLHTIHNSLVTSPPEGYKFIGNDTSFLYNLKKRISGSRIIRFVYHVFLKIFKTTKIIEATEKSNILNNANLLFSGGIIHGTNKPWVLYMFDHRACLAGNNYELFLKDKGKIEEALISDNCKKIVCTNKSPIPFMKKHFQKKIIDKIVLIRLAIKERKKKVYKKKDKIQILFMGSINNPQDFYIKGGLYVIETFKKLSKRNDVRLVIRCKIPAKIKDELRGLKNLTIIEEKIPFENIIKLYQDSSVLFMPGHNYSVTSFLEGMSFGLPIIALNTYAVEDFVKNNYNGIIVKRSSNIKGYKDEAYPTCIRSDKFMKEVINNRDPKVVNNLIKQIERLIKNRKLIKKMSSNCQKEVKKKYSLKVRNKGLKKVFDDIFRNVRDK